MQPYKEKERKDLLSSLEKFIMEDEVDLNNELKILNSSIAMFGTIKTLMKRASQ